MDASLRSTGFGLVESRQGRLWALESGLIRNPVSSSRSACLRHIQEDLLALLARGAPDAVALEGGFYFKNARTALVLGEVRGVVIATAAGSGRPVYEYPPRQVKQALTGFGGADKSQVSHMVSTILGLSEEPAEDAADALAVAVCHLHAWTGLEALRPKPL